MLWIYFNGLFLEKNENNSMKMVKEERFYTYKSIRIFSLGLLPIKKPRSRRNLSVSYFFYNVSCVKHDLKGMLKYKDRNLDRYRLEMCEIEDRTEK